MQCSDADKSIWSQNKLNHQTMVIHKHQRSLSAYLLRKINKIKHCKGSNRQRLHVTLTYTRHILQTIQYRRKQSTRKNMTDYEKSATIKTNQQIFILTNFYRRNVMTNLPTAHINLQFSVTPEAYFSKNLKIFLFCPKILLRWVLSLSYDINLRSAKIISRFS